MDVSDGCNSAAGRIDVEQVLEGGKCPMVGVGSEVGGGEDTLNIGRLSLAEKDKALSERYLEERDKAIEKFLSWSEQDQTDFVLCVLSRMCHHQHGQIDSFLKPMLQRDFITLLPGGLAENVLSLLDARSLAASSRVNNSWRRAIAHGMLWRKLIERKVRSDPLWRGLSEKRGWKRFIFISKEQATYTISLAKGYPKAKAEEMKRGQSKEALEFQHLFYCELYPQIVRDIDEIENNWRTGKHNLQRINCESENSKGVYCLQYDDDKIISGLRDNTIKIWRRKDLSRIDTLTGHTGSVLCLQYDERIIASGSSDATVRIWDVNTGAQLNTLIHHCEAVLHLRFQNGMLVTCSKDRSIAVWDLHSPKEIDLRRVLVGHRAAVNVVDFDQTYIVSASGDRTIKVWSVDTCEFVRTLNGHKRGIACLQYRDRLIVSGSSDFSIRLWDIECGTCLRVLEGHEELVRCIRFDSKRIVSGAYDGKIKVWDLQAALDLRVPPNNICIKTLSEHTGRVFRLQFDEFQIVSSSHDDTILIWDFLNATEAGGAAGAAANGNAIQQPVLQPIAPAAFPAPAGHHVQRPMPVHPGGSSPLIPQMPGLQLHGGRGIVNRNLPPIPPLPLLHHHRCAVSAEASPGSSSQLLQQRLFMAETTANPQPSSAPGPSTSRAGCTPSAMDDADVLMEPEDGPNIADAELLPEGVESEDSPPPPAESSRDQEEKSDE